MTVKLSFKMFIVFLATAACSIVLVVASNRYFANWNNEEHIRQKVEENLILLADALAAEYIQNGGWHFLTAAPRQWELVFQSDQSDDHPELLATNANTGLLFRIRDLAEGTETVDQEKLLTPPHSFSLFDSQKKLIAGFQGEFDQLKTIRINYLGAPIGWLGVNYSQDFPQLDKDLVEKLSVMFNTIGVVIFLVSTVVVFFFSRHLLVPIRQLSTAMKALTDRHFGTRIPVTRKDELGVLAVRFNTMAQQLQEYDRNQQQWLSDISHELRTPLAVLTGEIDALQDGILKLDKTSLASLGDEAKYLQRIVEDLHFISLAESGVMSMENKRFKPLPVLTQVICLFENRFKKGDMGIDVKLEPSDADIEIMGDQFRLKQVFSNLMENALRYTDKPGQLKIRQKKTGDRLIVSFEDSGPGVPEQAIPKLFERLYRAELSRNRKMGGSGIGLAICKTIIEGHQGEIEAANSEKAGLRIVISLPLIKV
jgi:two-component system sensor histidine kinase BaeS